MATITTASYGSSDTPFAPVEQDIEARWVCYTDDPGLEAPDPWQVIVEPPRHRDPCLAAKVHKMLPRTETGRESHAGSDSRGSERLPWIWIDANIEITSPSFAREALAAVNDGLALYRHPRRDCIYAEAEASLGAESQGGKYASQPIREQVASYRAGGHPEHDGLFACGVIAWNRPNPRLGPSWLAECVRWTYQDQLSFPVVCRRLGIEPGIFPHPQIARRRRGWLENPWLRIHPHRP